MHGNRVRTGEPGAGRTKFWILATVLVLVLAGVVWGAVIYASLSDQLKPADPADQEAVAEVVDSVPSDAGSDAESEPLYILILGADARPGQTRARSDTILLARIDLSDQTVSMLSFPRDSRVPVEGHGLDKITHANAFGGPALVIKTVQAYTGLPVNHYVELNFEGFVAAVDAVGGVTVNVERAINDRNGATTGGVSDVTYIPAGVQTLNAEQALTFVRSRAYPDGDFTRIKNQQKFLIAFAKQALAAENLTRLPGVADEVAGNITTDMSIPQLLSLAMDLKGLDDEDIVGYTVPGGTAMIDGVSYVVPDEEAARELFEAFRAGTVSETP